MRSGQNMMNNIKATTIAKSKYTWWDRIIEIEPIYTLTIWFGKIIDILKWIPILWNVRSWEGTDLLVVMDFQLARIQKAQQEDENHCDEKDDNILIGPQYAKVIQEARDCIERILEDNYCKKEQEAHDKKHGKLTMIDDGLAKNGLQRVKFAPDTKTAQRDRNRIYKLEIKRKKNDYDKLFNILKNDIEKWWT